MDALPKTYHHPIGPAAPRGIGCISIGPTVSRRLRRASNQARIRFIADPHAFAGFVQRVLQRGQVGRLDLQLTVADPPDAVEQAARRRSRGAFAILVIDPAVARTHEEAGLREPGHRAAQVGAVHGEDQELILLLVVPTQVADVDPHVGGHAVPRLAQSDSGTSPAGSRWAGIGSAVPARPSGPGASARPRTDSRRTERPGSRSPRRPWRRSATGRTSRRPGIVGAGDGV